jgi:hypothetical protein
VERFDQTLEVLVRLDVPDVERERVLQLVAGADPFHVLVGGFERQPFVDGVVDDRDLVGRHAEPAEDIELRRLGHRQHAVRSVGRGPQLQLGVGVGQAPGQILREHQVDAVVDRHHGPAVNRRREHVVRRMEEVDVLPQQCHRDADLLADRIRDGRLDDRTEVRTRDLDPPVVLRPAQQHVLRGPVDAPQVVDQVPDVGADAKVVVLPDVDGDAHG